MLITSRTPTQPPPLLSHQQPCILTPHSRLWASLYHLGSAWGRERLAWQDTPCSCTQALRYVELTCEAPSWWLVKVWAGANVISVLQARVSLPTALAVHSIPGRQVCIDTGLPPFFHMPPPAHAHAPAPSSPQPPPSPHSSHTHKVRAGRQERGRLVLTLTLSDFMFVSSEL